MSAQSWLSVLATSGTSASAKARMVRAEGQAHFSFTSTRAPARWAWRARWAKAWSGTSASLRPILGSRLNGCASCGMATSRSAPTVAVTRPSMTSAGERSPRVSWVRMSAGCTGPRSPGNWWSAISTRSTPRMWSGRSSAPCTLMILASTAASTSSPGPGRSAATADTKSGTHGESRRTWSARQSTRSPRSRAAATFSSSVLTASAENVE
jgi:hypothetical protein